MYEIKMKRIYEEASLTDGMRLLIDRLWPRGVKKEKAIIHRWLKDIAPSTELRKWFCHDPEKFEMFKNRYREELETEYEKSEAIKWILSERKVQPITLIYAAKDNKHNHAIVLLDHLNSFYE